MPDSHLPVNPSTWTELFRAASQLADLEPWQFASDAEVFGLTDPSTREVRMGHILGNAGMVFAAVVYRNGGIPWLLSMLDAESDPSPAGAFEAMDCVKLEWVHKRELEKEDLAALATSGIKIRGRGAVWPQFRSSKPGWPPWHIDGREARQLVSGLRQLTAHLRLFKDHPKLFDGRAHLEVPFLQAEVPNRELALDDLEWLPVVMPPDEPFEAATIAESDLKKLSVLGRDPDLALDFDARLVPEASFLKDGRPCFGRMALLVESDTGMVASFDLQAGGAPAGEAALSSFVALLLKAEILPTRLNVGTSKVKTALQSLCSQLGIQLVLAKQMPLLEEAFESLGQALASRGANAC